MIEKLLKEKRDLAECSSKLYLLLFNPEFVGLSNSGGTKFTYIPKEYMADILRAANESKVKIDIRIKEIEKKIDAINELLKGD